LDSVQSQANRMELALKEALDEEHLSAGNCRGFLWY
jgi:hypothetical protein